MAKKKTVAVIFGGPSAEHEVSLNTGRNIIAALKKSGRFSVKPIKISKKGEWSLNGKITSPLACLKNIDVVCNAMHGEFGEDGTIQGFLDTLNIPYTGSGMKASVIGIDKILTKQRCLEWGIRTPRFITVKRGEIGFKPPFKYPIVVKPNARGSSVGISIAKSKNELLAALKLAFKYDDEVLVEEFIRGREITVGILEKFRGNKYYALPITEIFPDKKHDFFNYEAKYKSGESLEITPAKLAPAIANQAKKLSMAVFQAIGARHYARADMILDKKGEIYVLEINTLPGLTSASLMPQQAAAIGLSLPKLLEHIIRLAMEP
jgi:D-alanine-D-alanine ligase